MEKQEKLYLDPDESTKAKKSKTPIVGLLATNHLNLMYILAAGLLMPPNGFGRRGDKYYQDTLVCLPGWIPLFIGKPFKDAIASTTREADYLKPCLAEITLCQLTGRVLVLRERDDICEVHFPDEIDGTERVIFVPAPLPASWIETIHFCSLQDKSACVAEARDFGNVPLSDFTCKATKTRFTKTLDAAWPPKHDKMERDPPLDAPIAAGGIMGMLLQVANKGDLGVQAYRLAFDLEQSAVLAIENPIIAGLGEWLYSGHARMSEDLQRAVSASDRLQKKLLWEAIDRLVAWKSSDTTETAMDVLLDHLKTASEGLDDDRLKSRVDKLRESLTSLMKLADSTATEILDRHPTPFSRALTLFFLRQKCLDLLGFDNTRLDESDWLTAAILFGVREGWLGLPLELRDVPGLGPAVSHRMAQMAHRMAGTDIDLGEAPPRPMPLRELFKVDSSGNVEQGSAAVLLARHRGWDCVETCISLGKGAYKLEINSTGMHIMVSGEPKIITKVDAASFFTHLGAERIEGSLDKKLREKLKA